eukprot:4385507-Amphidinium_carterae.1
MPKWLLSLKCALAATATLDVGQGSLWQVPLLSTDPGVKSRSKLNCGPLVLDGCLRVKERRRTEDISDSC